MSDSLAHHDFEDVLQSIRKLVSEEEHGRPADPAPSDPVIDAKSTISDDIGVDTLEAAVPVLDLRDITAQKPSPEPLILKDFIAPEPRTHTAPVATGIDVTADAPAEIFILSPALRVGDDAYDEDAVDTLNGIDNETSLDESFLYDSLVPDAPFASGEEDPLEIKATVAADVETANLGELVTRLAAAVDKQNEESFEAEEAENGRRSTSGNEAFHTPMVSNFAPTVQEDVADAYSVDVDLEATELAVDMDAPEATPPLASMELGDEEQQLIEDEVLEDLIQQIIREELQGDLGQRITQNVRKLVRSEMSRALSERGLLD
ncbi:MAG: hypothetical protein ACPGVK_07610 [Halocynthiibacter sp.]